MLFRQLDLGGGTPGLEEDRRDLAEVFTAAIRGADAYAAVRRAAKSEEGVLRLGNRFVRKSQLREVAFLAVGQCAAAMARAFHDSLGEVVTQGLVIGPEPPPDPWPFLYRRVTEPMLPSAEGVAAAAEALELAQGLKVGDLFVPLLSSGTVGMLASPPSGMAREEYRDLLQEVAESPSSPEDLNRVAALLSPAQGGRLAEAAGLAEVEALVVDRGEGGAWLGGSPVSPPPPDLPVQVRSLLVKRGLAGKLPASVRATLLEGARPSAGPSEHPSHTVVVAGPADALETAGAEAGARKHLPRLVELRDASSPEGAANRLLAALEERAPTMGAKDGEGIALFSGVTLGTPEGGALRDPIARFLAHAQAKLTRREATVGILSTVGSTGPGSSPSGGFVDATSSFDPAKFRPGARGALDLRPGFTDVGAVAVVFLTKRSAPARQAP